MAVSIKQVAVTNFGPLGTRVFDLGRLNLIYGRNETGKTFFTELLLQSIFKHTKETNWPTRILPGQGKVIISGLDEEDISFAPSSRKKIEDFWEEKSLGLPLNMARLLVVKGAELELIQSSKETNRGILKNILSQNILLDQILAGVTATTQNASIKNGEIIGDNRGDLNRRLKIIKEMQRIEDLFTKIKANYSLGPIRELEIQLKAKQEAVDSQIYAKQHHAYRLQQEITNLKNALEQVTSTSLSSLRDNIRDYENAVDETNQLRQELKEKELKTQHFTWLEQAVMTWEKMDLGTAGKANRLTLILGGVLVFAGMITVLVQGVLSLLGEPGVWVLLPTIISILFLIFGSGLLLYYIWRQEQFANDSVKSEERHSIQAEYLRLFGMPINSLTDLNTQIANLREDYVALNDLRKRIHDREARLLSLKHIIQNTFQEITGNAIDERNWNSEYKSQTEKREAMSKKLQECELTLGLLAVEEQDYQVNPGEVHYDRPQLLALQDEKLDIEKAYERNNHDLQDIKGVVCRETGDDISTPWSSVLENLMNLRDEINQEYRQLTAKIVGEIGVVKTLEVVRAQEDEDIQNGLRSEEVAHVLSRVTQHYAPLAMDDDNLKVFGTFGDYELTDLSTGARDQVYLALRIGFASRLAGGNPLFMVLDDAFQYSDWIRRERLFEVAFDLVEDGWQVTYLTMDDHIRDICSKMGENRLGDQFHFEEIG